MLAYAGTVNEGRHTIHTGGDYDLHLLVPMVRHEAPRP